MQGEVIHQLSRDDAMRLIGHRDGIITALLQVRQQIARVRLRFEHTPSWQVRRVRTRDELLRPLLDLEQNLNAEIKSNQTAIAGQASLIDRPVSGSKDGGGDV